MISEKKWKNTKLIIYIYLFDMCLLPTFHISSLPFKVAYLIAFITAFLYMINRTIKLGSTRLFINNSFVSLKNNPRARNYVLSVVGIIALTILGEITAFLSTNLVNSSPFRNAIFFYIVLIGSIIIGYAQFNYNKDFLIVLLILYCGINIVFSTLGTAAPFFLRRLYLLTGENEGFYFSLRTVGTMGNPNATLCVMNVLYMSIVVFFRRGEIAVNSFAKLIAIVLLPLVTNCFINSRGEFLVTSILTVIMLFSLLHNNKELSKTIIRLIIIIILGIVAIYLIFGYLAPRFPTVAYSINRLSSIFRVGTNTSVDTDSLSDRPFIHAIEFWDRFKTSPIWGTGFGIGNSYPYIRSCESFHNDWFRIFGSSGILGGIIWIKMIYYAVKRCGLFYILPFFITAVSNTFIASPMALGIYFITIMSVIRADEQTEKGIKS